MFSTTCGRNSVAISSAKSALRPRKRKRPNPYAVIVEEITVKITRGITYLYVLSIARQMLMSPP